MKTKDISWIDGPTLTFFYCEDSQDYRSIPVDMKCDYDFFCGPGWYSFKDWPAVPEFDQQAEVWIAPLEYFIQDAKSTLFHTKMMLEALEALNEN